jgi:two-component system phosphate regulon sensor histidine kinase PhoR
VRSHAERQLIVLMIVVSSVLTGLTVWAVAEQGRALQARELADLRNTAATAAARRQAALLADVARALDAAGRAWEVGSGDELDAWAAGAADWLLVCSRSRDGAWVVYPLTPLEQPPPVPDTSADSPSTGGRDLLSTLRDFQKLATNPDPLTRSGALLAMAACEQQLGHPLAAARIFADAAQLLRSTPRLARFAFRAELSRIDSLVTAGDQERAREALSTFVNSLLGDHPARIGRAEITRLQDQAAALRIPANDPTMTTLAQLAARGARRAAIAAAAARLAPAQPDTRLRFFSGATTSNEAVVIAVRAVDADTQLALVNPAADILAHYWGPQRAETTWRVCPPGAQREEPVLIELGPEFGGAALVPTPAAAHHLRAVTQRNLAIVAGTTAGIVAAWVLVIWMFMRMVARQRELVRLQGRFVADVSHELKTPLALIRLLSETLAGRRVRDPERIQAYHETITRESERLSMLLENILDLGRIESGRKRYEFSTCDMAAVARQAWTLFEPQFTEEGFDAGLALAHDLPPIKADPQALQQVIVNLLQNAHRYAGDGKYVRLSVAREGYVVLITVEDHGLGMTRSQLDRLGESFFRAEDTRVRQTRGVGLGLAIAHHIVQAHRGKIEVESRPGQGSKFTVWIPFEPLANE